ncbi:MAG: GNAT family N-acetyltransferase [Minisyncoccia bacterium]
MIEKHLPMEEKNIIEILVARNGDIEKIQKLIAKSSKGMYKLCGWSDEEIDNHFTEVKIEEGIKKFKEVFKDFSDSDILLVAKNDNSKIVGFCLAEKLDNINRIEAIYILPEFQNQGIATKLFTETYKRFDANHDTYLEVFSLNSKAIKFYKKLGFIETGKIINETKFTDKTGQMLQETEMVLPGRN